MSKVVSWVYTGEYKLYRLVITIGLWHDEDLIWTPVAILAWICTSSGFIEFVGFFSVEVQNANWPGHLPFYDWTVAGPNAASSNHHPYHCQVQATECGYSAGGLHGTDTIDADIFTWMGKVNKWMRALWPGWEKTGLLPSYLFVQHHLTGNLFPNCNASWHAPTPLACHCCHCSSISTATCLCW